MGGIVVKQCQSGHTDAQHKAWLWIAQILSWYLSNVDETLVSPPSHDDDGNGNKDGNNTDTHRDRDKNDLVLHIPRIRWCRRTPERFSPFNNTLISLVVGKQRSVGANAGGTGCTVQFRRGGAFRCIFALRRSRKSAILLAALPDKKRLLLPVVTLQRPGSSHPVAGKST